MVKKCCIRGCRSESYGGCGLSFYGFPKNEELLQKWIKYSGMPVSKKITKSMVICSRHFKKEDFVDLSFMNSRPSLKRTAVPSISTHNMPMQSNVFYVPKEMVESNHFDEDEDNLHRSPSPPDSSSESETSNNAKRMKMRGSSEEREKVNSLELETVSANVTCKLKKMNSEQRCHAELLINKVLYHGLRNTLTSNTDLAEMEHPPD